MALDDKEFIRPTNQRECEVASPRLYKQAVAIARLMMVDSNEPFDSPTGRRLVWAVLNRLQPIPICEEHEEHMEY